LIVGHQQKGNFAVGGAGTLRFGYQSGADDPAETVRSARAAEDAGFDVFHIGDHVGAGPSALASLAAAASGTSTIRLCPLVLNNDLRHPVVLAQELATIDRLCGGRLEVGLGAGHSFTEYAAIGQAFDPPAIRKARLAEASEILRKLLDGERVTYTGEHYRIHDAVTLRPAQEHVPMLIAVNGRKALAHAARHADTVGLTMLGRTLADGQSHEARWEPERLDATVGWLREQAVDRRPRPELHALIQSIVITKDREKAATAMAGRIRGLGVEDALVTPFLALGTHDQIADHLLASRERWGISYYSVRDIDAFAPVIERVRSPGAQSDDRGGW
jgi:probable F420-dependent oxidoreductase